MKGKFLNKEIKVDWDGFDINYAKLCINHIESLSDSLINQIVESSINYHHYIEETKGNNPSSFSPSSKILDLIDPIRMSISDPLEDGSPLLSIECNCEWYFEGGILLFVHGDQIVYLGPFDGLDPGDEHGEDSMNFAPNAQPNKSRHSIHYSYE